VALKTTTQTTHPDSIEVKRGEKRERMRKEVAGKFQSATKKEEKYRYLSGIYKAQLHNLSQNTHKHTQCHFHHSKIRFDILAYKNRT
jgi:hypothetical protein